MQHSRARVVAESYTRRRQSYLLYQWAITNTSSASISGLKFFHGQDNFFPTPTDMAQPSFTTSNKTISLRSVTASQYEIANLRALTDPFAFAAGLAPALKNSVTTIQGLSTFPSVDSGGIFGPTAYAFEWRKDNLLPGDVWTIDAAELRSSDPTLQYTVVSPPLGEVIQDGQTKTIEYVVTNDGPTQSSVTAGVSGPSG